jgi:polyisoprenoid-binding protein YceI
MLSAIALGCSAQALDKYQIDPSHASVVFKINHLGFSNVYGMFGDVSGDLSIDEKSPTGGSVDFTIKAASIDTKSAKRDEHLAKPDFFDSKQFPLISFKSKSVKKLDDKNYEVAGTLTMHGVVKPLSFKLARFRTGADMQGKQRTGGETIFKVKRSDYGMNFLQGPNMVGDEVEIMVSAEAVKQ